MTGGKRSKTLRQAEVRRESEPLRTLEARWRRLRFGLIVAGVVVFAGLATGIAIAVSGSGGSSTAATVGTKSAGAPVLPLGSLASLGTLQPIGSVGSVGPEGLPIPNAPVLVSSAISATGQVVDGIQCLSNEQTIFHIHAHLTIFVNGTPRQIPAGIGIPGAQYQQTPRGPFVDSGSCFTWLHTHAADGIIHIESPVQRTYTLGNFFDEWGQPLGPRQVGPSTGTVTGTVTAIYNGKRYEGNPRDIPLNAHAQIQLEVGAPWSLRKQ